MKNNSLLILTVYSLLATCAFAEDVIFKESNFKILSYSSIKPNEFVFNDTSLDIKVDSSASPLIYPLESSGKYSKMTFSARFNSKVKTSGPQGDKGHDDFSLRVGVVYEGDRTLNFFQRAVAAKWITTLFELAPKGTGVSQINFFNTYVDKRLASKSRVHPLSDLLVENFVGDLSTSNEVSVSVDLDRSKKILALWISSDGDDTQSKYIVEINQISLVE